MRDQIEKTQNFMGTGIVVNISPAGHMGLDLLGVPDAGDQERRLGAGELIERGVRDCHPV